VPSVAGVKPVGSLVKLQDERPPPAVFSVAETRPRKVSSFTMPEIVVRTVTVLSVTT